MSEVVLGGIVFYDQEIPAKMPFGGTQELKVQMMVGGQRKVDAMGADPGDITWTGRFRGALAVLRAQSLDAMRIAGAQLPLTWLGLYYTVVIKKFEAVTEKAFEVPYTITVTVVDDPMQSSGSPPASLDSLVGGDVATAAAILTPAPSNIASGLASLTTAISAVGTLQGSPVSALAPALTSAQALSALALATIAANDAALDTASPDSSDPSVMAAWLSASAGAVVAQSILADGGPYVSRVATNLVLGGS